MDLINIATPLNLITPNIYIVDMASHLRKVRSPILRLWLWKPGEAHEQDHHSSHQ